jgi:hypothetical protein
VDADTWTLEKLFDTPIRYLVPLYQRPYVWSRKRQWEPLWADFRNLAERWLDNQARGVNADVETAAHFLGAVVLEQIANATGTVELRNVIDGQQRLTTLQVALDAIESVVREHGDGEDRDLLRDLIINSKKVKQADERFKVWPTNVDRDAFVAAMDDDGDRVSFADSNLMQCHDYFTAEARSWALEEGPDAAPARLHGLTVALMGRVQIVVIDLEDGDNPQVIFETLNDRGEPLLAGDLVKNEILHRVVRDQGEQAMEDCYESTWRDFDTDPFWRTEIRQGRFKRPRLDVLLFHWLTIRTKQLASVGQEFLAFRRHVASENLKVTDVAVDLSSAAVTWRRLEEEPRTTPLGISLSRLNVLDAGALRPLTLYLFNDANLTEEQELEGVQAIESWAVRRAICKMPSMGMNRFIVDLISRLGKHELVSVVDALRADLATQTANVSVWPSDERVVEVLTTQPLYNRISQARVRLVLEALEDFRRDRKTEELAPEHLSIEHVLPGGWTNEAWQLPPDDPDGQKRRQMIDTLGNLTLLTSSLNSAQSNGSWPAKREGLKQSVLRLNRELDGLPDWTEVRAAERGKRLAEEVLLIWPRPADQPVGADSASDSEYSVTLAPSEIEDPSRDATASEQERAGALLGGENWPAVAAVLVQWCRLVFGDTAAASAGTKWGVTAHPGGGRLVVLHVGSRDAVTIRDNGVVEYLSASPVEGAGESVSADEDDEVVNLFESLDGAFEGLLLEGSKSEIKAWLSGRPADPLRKGYCNPLVAEDLTGRLTQAPPATNADA